MPPYGKRSWLSGQEYHGLMKNLNALIKAKRRKLETVMLRSKCQSDEEAYHRVRNRYTASLYNAKRKYYSELIDQCSEDNGRVLGRSS